MASGGTKTRTTDLTIERPVDFKDLPPRYRAALVLREVLNWEPSEIAELLQTNVAGINNMLQRASAALASEKGRQPR